jgi:hypothetical protein
VSIKNFLKIPLNRNSLSLKGVMNFLFSIYPFANHNTRTAKKYLKTEYSSDFEMPKINAVFHALRQLVAKEMVRRNNKRRMEGPCHLSVTTWRGEPLGYEF